MSFAIILTLVINDANGTTMLRNDLLSKEEEESSFIPYYN